MAIAIKEFGGQHTDLIGNRIGEMGIDVIYESSDAPHRDDVSGYILSGGPKSVYKADSYKYDPQIFKQDKPLLGICYGMQLLAKELGGGVYNGGREYGETQIVLKQIHPLFDGFSDREIVWMNHGDSVDSNGNYDVLGISGKGIVAAISSKTGRQVGVQFHPEVTHTEKGRTLLRNFTLMCNEYPRNVQEERFDVGRFIEEVKYELAHTIGSNEAYIFLSGGVDSTVAAALAKEAGIRIRAITLNMGLGRKGEVRHARNVGKMLGEDVYVHPISARSVHQLSKLSEAEEKRKAFVLLYAEAIDDVNNLFGIGPDDFVIQGTIATDRRESGREAGKGETVDKGTAALIKTHHNVGAEKHIRGNQLYPLRGLTKDRVRIVARELGLPQEVSERQPYPGPGLLVRFITAYYPVNDELYNSTREIAHSHGLNGYVLPRKGVGVKGDDRAQEHIALLVGDRDWKRIRQASKEIIEELPVCRVAYLPEEERFDQNRLQRTIDFPFDRHNLDLLREATEIVETTMRDYNVKSSQTPVVIFGGHDAPWLVIRDVQSEDFRTVRPLKKPDEFPWECYDKIVERIRRNSALRRYDKMRVAFDVSDKPGGTTEME
ncbi:MAG: gamma-glutamyl-gamma-aminobutyrate hydrolase family protein [Candidatus Aenigmarchaeota archaeon]|nr:gamma-glutamyl-gamma-aminobutyrate hydrolase family protein [Candidatus Aenigmarchaeota archaeon]